MNSKKNTSSIEDNKTPEVTTKKKITKSKTTTRTLSPSGAKITNYFRKKVGGEDLATVKTTTTLKMTPVIGDNNEIECVKNMNVDKELSGDNNVMNSEQNVMKTTFSNNGLKSSLAGQNKSARKNICVFVGGKCEVHRKKLIRSFKLKKMSVVGKDGMVTWVTREVTALVCPVITPSRVSYDEKAIENPSGSGGTNRKKRKITHVCVNQPDSEFPIDEG